jgi:hypothetical protein
LMSCNMILIPSGSRVEMGHLSPFVANLYQWNLASGIT